MLEIDGSRVNYRLDGPERGPVLMLSNPLASDLTIWDLQVSALLRAGYRVLRYDGRGQGRSDAPEGPYSMAQLARDALALIDALELERTSFCGCSLGAMVGQTLAIEWADRIESLVLCATTAHMPPREMWDDRISVVREKGMDAIAEGAIERWFTVAGRDRLPQEVERVRRSLLATSVEGFCACAIAIRDMDHRERIGAISTPTLVVVGEHDVGTPVAAARLVQEKIPGAELVVVPGAPHLVNVERADEFNQMLINFLEEHRATQR
jgi:3-oxoadipate enol-lactonase